MVSSSHELYLLKSNAVLIPPTDEKPYYQISVTNQGCTVCIAATKSFSVPPHIHPLHPDFKIHQPKPADYLTVTHKTHCECAAYSKNVLEFFKAWRQIYLDLRYKPDDNSSYAFYPEFEYETGESLAIASLVGSLALGKQIPGCYEFLIKTFGTLNAKGQLEDDTDSDSDSDGHIDGYESGSDTDDSSVHGLLNWSNIV